jgi:hypothetical protein
MRHDIAKGDRVAWLRQANGQYGVLDGIAEKMIRRGNSAFAYCKAPTRAFEVDVDNLHDRVLVLCESKRGAVEHCINAERVTRIEHDAVFVGWLDAETCARA